MSFRYHKYGIIISIDFGTTFSGTCFCITGELATAQLIDTKYPEITAVTSWPNQSKTENKTPSLVIYDRNFHLLHWGEAARRYIENGDLKSGEIVKERFKLELPSSVPQKGAIFITNNAKKTEHENMRATIDYFREIFDHTVSTIRKDSGDFFLVEKENIRFVITVPTLWNDVQRDIMRTVAKEAGLITDEDNKNRLLIINDSVAAALYCEQRKTDDEKMIPGDRYIVCDAGGGTVSLAVYEFVESITGDPADSSRRFQSTTGISEKCGSTFIDVKMRELLTLFCYGGVATEDREEEKARDRLFSPVMDKFISEIKPVFGKRSREFKFPNCKHAKHSKTYTGPISKGPIDEGDHNDGQCIVCKAEDFKYMTKPNFGDPTIVILRDAIIVPVLKLYLPEGVKYERTGGMCKLTIPYDIMRTQVFEEVTKRTLILIDRQIKKANCDIKRTYLVGGFGNSPYLQKRILKAFYIKGTFFPNSLYRIGTLITDYNGNSAAMRGAMVYGIDGSRRQPQTDVVERKFGNASTDKYNTLICLDIGYLSTSCSYRDLGNESDEMTEITNWPGLENPHFMIPTAKETVNGQTTWGAKVKQPIDPDHEKLIAPSKLMSIVKADLGIYICEYLKLVLGHVHETIAEANSELSSKDGYRYVITMENCYRFFSKSEMRYIAQLAGIISKKDPFERLLLIGRDTAAAMYTEREHFSGVPAYTNHVLQINMYHDICSLSLMEHTKINGNDIDSTDEQDTGIFRNVRSVRSATFDFDFTKKIVSYLNSYVLAQDCIKCNGSHGTYGPTYFDEIKRGFLNYIKTKLNFNNNNETQSIPITDAECCTASIKVYDLLEHIFRPAVKDFVSEINRFVSETDMTQHFSFDKILLSGILLDTSTPNYDFLERIVINNISEVMNIQTEFITPSKHNGKEALLGAEIYGNHPEKFTERVARTSYAVNVRAFGLQEFETIAKKKIAEEIARSEDKKDLKKKIYDIESAYGHASDEKVDFFYQPRHNPPLYTSAFGREEDDLIYLIRRGDKILEKDEYEGILEKFYAYEDCIVYATIYSSNADGLPAEGIKMDNPNFRKIQEFELYVKHDEDNPMTDYEHPRLYFDIFLIFDNDEAKFEVRTNSDFGKKIPEFRSRDEFLVANIYDDRQFIEVGNLTVGFMDVTTVQRKFKYASTNKYNIGYLSTSCSYRDLRNESDEMTGITNWPGLENPHFMIPTAKETVNGQTNWGAKVKQPIDPDHRKRITPSKLMSSAKASLRHYFREYLTIVLDHVHALIAETNPDRNKYRYVITMENCYQFFDNKSEMRYIAQLAGIISKEDPVERLLLIGRDTAAALYTEKEHFSGVSAYTNHVLQINMYHDICSLSLMEHTKTNGNDIDSTDEQDTGIFRNVRSVRSATFDFDFTKKIVSFLNSYISTNDCIECTENHSAYSPTYYTELERGFLNYVKTRLNFYNYTEVQKIPITDSECCTASIKVYNLLEYIFIPAVKDLASEINRFVSETDMMQYLCFAKILLSGILLDTSTPNYDFLERIVINNISEVMNIQTEFITPSKHNGKEALLGAEIYGNRPEYFTERVARYSYAVNVCAYESAYGHVNEDKEVDLFYQPPLDLSSYTSAFARDDDLTYLIRGGDKILEKDEYEGILEKFYAYEDCIVYATIYYSDADDLPAEGIKTDNPNFRKIHQFELYVKRDEDNPITDYEHPRLYFDICLTFKDDEAMFEAIIGSELGKKIPEFRFRDEFLVANIYDDRQFIDFGNLTIGEPDSVTAAEAEDVNIAEVDNIPIIEVSDLTSAEVDGVTTAEIEDITTAEVEDMNISEVDDIPVSKLTIDTPRENMSDTTIVRKKSSDRLSFYFNKFFGST
ncbi:hypothetical protein HPULCUR_006655 [Helicostylum pulchrum]|uniref:Uncharacterized protein n=1 Tax=Helicostylum pulchrum TaxID=562976 RepID=A0ABP9Y2J4_9FUNG